MTRYGTRLPRVLLLAWLYLTALRSDGPLWSEIVIWAAILGTFLTVLGLFKLRITHPDLPRPYRAWGYPLTPAVFLLVTAFMMYYLLAQRPLQAVLGSMVMMSGLLIYLLTHRRAGRAAVVALPGSE